MEHIPAIGVINPNTGNLQNVWNNALLDGSFGVTSPIFLDQITTGGTPVNPLAIDPTQIVTSLSSKSELALNLSAPEPGSLWLVGGVLAIIWAWSIRRRRTASTVSRRSRLTF